MLPANEITWSLLWALFTPNCMMYHFHQYTEQPQVLLMRRIRQRYRKDGTPYWHVMCDMIADDGLKFGYTKDLGIASRPDLNADLEIDQYDGARRIQDLIVYPLEYAANPAQIRKDLVERGKKYARMIGNTYWETSGPAMRETMNDRYEVNRFKFSTHGRAMIDTASFRTYNPNWACIPTVQSTLDRTKLTDDQHLICAPFVGGFGFGDKKWGGFPVSRLQEVVWSDEPFHSLVIGAKQKTLIHSLVKQHSSKGTGYDDVIQGKGLGLIGLLSGRPGCGKTLTAEAVAEVTKRPLYAVSAGELGTDVEKVDKQLTLILELSHRWSAVLLLDEADVFLQERDTKDVARNALVSIFLRQLEYFQGILILTTNRIGDCDPAFESKSAPSFPNWQINSLTTECRSNPLLHPLPRPRHPGTSQNLETIHRARRRTHHRRRTIYSSRTCHERPPGIYPLSPLLSLIFPFQARKETRRQIHSMLTSHRSNTPSAAPGALRGRTTNDWT